VKVASVVEMLNVPAAATRPASLAQVSDESPQTFKESLFVASKASPGAGAANQTGAARARRQQSVSSDAELPSTMPQVRAVPSPATPEQTVPQQISVAQQLPLINPALTPMQLPFGEPGLSASAAGQPMRDVPTARYSTLESKLAQPVFAKSDSVPSSHAAKESDPPQAASILPAALPLSPIATNLSNATPSALSSTLPTSPANAVANADHGNGPSTLSTEVPSTASSTDPSADPSLASKPVPVTVSSAFPGVAQDADSPVITNAIPDASSNAGPTPVLHGAGNPSARGDVASQPSAISTRQANPPAVPPDPSGLVTDLIPGATADQLLALIPPGGGLLVAAHATASSVNPAAVAKPPLIAVANGKDGANNAIVDATGLKQHAPAASDQTGSQTGSQGTAASDDQSQGSASQQGQSAVPAQVNFANHTIAAVDHAQNLGGAAPSQTAPTLAGAPGHTAKTPDIPAPATIALPQAVPVINTAKLIQSMGQSEMRVGMRSNDFGNISISTSATRDLISAQISLDHGELARTLAAHLPEMQARLGGNQAMDVRIDMNGQAMGQGAGTSPGMSNGSPDGSRGDRQQKGGATSNQSADGFSGWGSSIAPAGSPSPEGRMDARLDIRV